MSEANDKDCGGADDSVTRDGATVVVDTSVSKSAWIISDTSVEVEEWR